MKKMDEMERNIQLRSEEWGYRTVLLALGIWTLFNCWQTLGKGASYRPLPGLIFCFTVGVQGIFQAILRQRMIAGEEEYREPNRLFRIIIGTVTTAAVLLFLGTFFILSRQSI